MSVGIGTVRLNYVLIPRIVAAATFIWLLVRPDPLACKWYAAGSVTLHLNPVEAAAFIELFDGQDRQLCMLCYELFKLCNWGAARVTHVWLDGLIKERGFYQYSLVGSDLLKDTLRQLELFEELRVIELPSFHDNGAAHFYCFIEEIRGRRLSNAETHYPERSNGKLFLNPWKDLFWLSLVLHETLSLIFAIQAQLSDFSIDRWKWGWGRWWTVIHYSLYA